MTDLTVIIPYREGTPAALLEETLASVLENRPEGLEILVINAGGYSDCYSIQEEGVHFVPASSESGLVDCVNIGLAEASHSVVQILLCGLNVPENWVDRALSHFQSSSAVLIPSVFENLDSQKRLSHNGWFFQPSGLITEAVDKVDSSAGKKSLVHAPTRFSAFFRKELLLELGGFPNFLPLDFAMIDAVLSLREQGYTVEFDPDICLELLDISEEAVNLFDFWMYREVLACRWSKRHTGVALSFFEKLSLLFSGKYFLWSNACRHGRALAREYSSRKKN